MHRLIKMDTTARTGICSQCGPVSVRKKGYTKAGNQKWRCSNSGQLVTEGAIRRHYEARNRHRVGGKDSYRAHVGPSCERCGFDPEHECQLDVHHIDHDHSNDDPTNLRTLCSNCHRLEHVRRSAPC